MGSAFVQSVDPQIIIAHLNCKPRIQPKITSSNLILIGGCFNIQKCQPMDWPINEDYPLKAAHTVKPYAIT